MIFQTNSLTTNFCGPNLLKGKLIYIDFYYCHYLFSTYQVLPLFSANRVLRATPPRSALPANRNPWSERRRALIGSFLQLLFGGRPRSWWLRTVMRWRARKRPPCLPAPSSADRTTCFPAWEKYLVNCMSFSIVIL